MIKVLGVFFILLFSIENSLADMLSVTTGGQRDKLIIFDTLKL